MISLKRQFLLSLFTLSILIFATVMLSIAYSLRIRTAPDDQIYYIRGKAGELARNNAVKFSDYDAMLLGSSMSTNFLCSDFDRLFNTHSVKLADNGFSLPENMKLASLALSRKKGEIKYIQVDLTSPHFIPPSSTDILQVDSIQSQSEYIRSIISFDTFLDALSFFSGSETTPIPRDEYAIWYKDENYKNPILHFAKALQKHPGPHEEAYNYTHENTCKAEILLKHDVLPLVRNYPHTTFLFFFPPYSFLAYENCDWDCLIEYKRMVMNMLCQFDNVQLFDFQNVTEISSVLENYRDYSHYMEHINAWILEQMAQGNYRVRPENIEDMLAAFRQTLATYDYTKDRNTLNTLYETTKDKEKEK